MIMASQTAVSDYELTLKILSVMDVSKPIALVKISTQTGLKMADVIRLNTRLVSANIIHRTVDNGNIFYTLCTDEYEDAVASIYEIPSSAPSDADENTRTMSSRDAIRKRRLMRSSGSLPKIDAKTTSTPEKKKIGPERLSALDLLAIKRASGSHRVVDAHLGTMRQNVKSSSAYPKQARDNDNVRLSGSRASSSRNYVSSTSHKAVYINKPKGRLASNTSPFNLPPSPLDQTIERSDGIVPIANPEAGKTNVPLIPHSALNNASAEIPENEVRSILNIPPQLPLIAILSPMPHFNIWSSCSALANSGGGYIVLGMRKYVKDCTVSYYVKNVNTPENAVKNILKCFNDRNIISDCPKDPGFISVCNIKKKHVIVINVDPALFAPAPVYLMRNSYGMKTREGCFVYKDNTICACTVDDVKNLWLQRRLGSDTPDWNQTSEQADIQLTRKKRLHLPEQIDDAVRPLSRKISTYGQPVSVCKLPPRTRRHISQPDDMYEGERILANGGFEKSPRPKGQTLPFDEPKFREIASKLETVRNVMFAEDITVPGNEHISCDHNHANRFIDDDDVLPPANPPRKPLVSHVEKIAAPEPLNSLPPLFADADRARLDEIVQPVIERPRLPMTRVCEIAAQLCLHARFTISELAEVLHKKIVPVKDKIMPALRENPNFVSQDGVFYIKK